jgi:8-oxo-dGTP pyrophosphatase MutT (NUDIX family)
MRRVSLAVRVAFALRPLRYSPGLLQYTPELRETVEQRLAAHPRRQHELQGRRHAAVAVVLVDGDPAEEGPAFLLCERAAGLSRHPGQWGLPGGRVEPGETALQAALRELDEELGVQLGPSEVVGWLDDYPSRSGFVITPLVVWGGANPELRPAPGEVASVHRVALQLLLDSEPRSIQIPESERPVLQLPLGAYRVHAPTGALLLQFRQVALLGRAGERVDHFDQPVFAWR